jgi:hypothetical protein
LRAFIIRPFGEKKFGKDQISVNFDDVEKTLIQPALHALTIEGATTAEILEPGNIRIDMFQLLLVADLVIADLSMHNANVFYELGIRHALRDKRTFLLYSATGDEQRPFDLQTDRFLIYDHSKPEDSRDALIAGLRKTLDSDKKDSPVFTLLPELRSQDPGRFLIVPPDFRAEVDLAESRKQAGMLALLAAEVSGLVWEREGLRIVARAQFRNDLRNAAADTWQQLLRIDSADREGNLELGSIYQSVGELDASDAYLKCVLDDPEAQTFQKAEAHALRARNAAEHWRRAVANAKPLAKQSTALLSPWLEESYTEFRQAFEQNLRAYIFGVEALGRLTVRVHLAEKLTDAWVDAQNSKREAERILEDLRDDLARLRATVELSIEIAEREEKSIDVRIARAQLTLLTAEKINQVRIRYTQIGSAVPADIANMRRFLAGFADLDVLTGNVQAATEVIDQAGQAESNPESPTRVLLYRGYGRELLSCEVAVRDWIRSQIEAEIKAAGGAARIVAIAGGGCGGDLLFHEICQDLKITSHVYLPFAKNHYIAQFVQCDDPQWVERFGRLITTVKLSFLLASPDMPKWLKDRPEYTTIRRWNSWMLSVACSSAPDVTLIAICDEARPGPDQEGVFDMVQQARQTGVKPLITSPAVLVGGGPRKQPVV